MSWPVCVIFDLDETLLVFQSLLENNFSPDRLSSPSNHNIKVAKENTKILSQIIAHFCINYLFLRSLETSCISICTLNDYVKYEKKNEITKLDKETIQNDCISVVTKGSADLHEEACSKAIATRMKYVKAWYRSSAHYKVKSSHNLKEKGSNQLFSQVTSEKDLKEWEAGLQALQKLNQLTGGWLTHARKVMTDLQKLPVELYLVTSGHILATVVKLALMGFQSFFPPTRIYSSCVYSKKFCFDKILESFRESVALRSSPPTPTSPTSPSTRRSLITSPVSSPVSSPVESPVSSPVSSFLSQSRNSIATGTNHQKKREIKFPIRSLSFKHHPVDPKVSARWKAVVVGDGMQERRAAAECAMEFVQIDRLKDLSKAYDVICQYVTAKNL